MNKISIKAVVIGGATDIVTSTLFGAFLGFYAASGLDFTHIPKDQIQTAVTTAIHDNVFLHNLGIAVGLAASTFGGYIAARIARHDEILNGTLSCFLCVAIGIYSMAYGSATTPIWKHLLLLLSSPLFAYFGGYLRLKQTAKRS